MNSIQRIKAGLLCILSMLMILGADSARAGQNMVFYGQLNIPPVCTVNNGQTIDVDFGDRVGVNKVDGQNYIQTLNYKISCGAGSSGLTMGLMVSGNVTAFDTAALQTNVTYLGVRILMNGQPLILNKRIDIDAANPPLLQAVPVKKSGEVLSAGTFTVSATMLVNYL